MPDQRKFIAAQLQGDVLEIGPGSRPYPTAPGARVTYADRSVPGGRGPNWPELKDAPGGPNADYNVDLDRDGLRMLATASRDAIVASHVIEHVANPIAALVEFQRVLRPGGRLVLIVPDREHTFDWVREPTTFAHLWAEYRAGAVEVSEDHITEFCRSIYMQPPMHPPQVRAWHDPKALNAALLALHRRRSIHVHCWAPEEFASLLVNLLREGILAVDLSHAYFREHVDRGHGQEFGFVLRKQDSKVSAPESAARFIADWCRLALDTAHSPQRRIHRFETALRRDLPAIEEALVNGPGHALAARGLRAPRARVRPRDLLKVVLRTRQAMRERLLPATRPQLPF